MEWLELTIQSASDGMELLETMLSMNRYDSFIVDDAQDFENFLETNKDYWDVIDNDLTEKMRDASSLRLYLEDTPAAMEEICRLKELLQTLPQQWPDADFGTLEVQTANVRNEDWENNWKQYYQPIPIGRKLLVVPKWMQPDNPENRIPVLLDPGMIFGTGAHASTQMCMTALESLVKGGEEVIDLGSGSGILSITAIKLGARHAIGIDVDPKAEDIARENAAYNDIFEDRFTAVTGNVIAGQKELSEILSHRYDIVCMNIFPDVIIPMAPILPGIMHESSVVVCSGILNTRLQEVLDALDAAGLEVLSQQEQSDWCCLLAKKNT